MTRETDYFKTFCKISKAFGTTATKNELLKLIVESAVDSMSGKAACLFLADERQGIFVPMAQTGLSDNYLHASPLKARRTFRLAPLCCPCPPSSPPLTSTA